MADEPAIRRTRRNLPHWSCDHATYFVTFHLAAGVLSVSERRLVFRHILDGHKQFYCLLSLVVMPTHVHLLARTQGDLGISRVLKGIKGASARKVNAQRKTKGKLWQEESWDRILRNHLELDEKLQYMAMNPVKEGLARTIEEYEFWFCDKELI